jgi:hypothetical protein
MNLADNLLYVSTSAGGRGMGQANKFSSTTQALAGMR